MVTVASVSVMKSRGVQSFTPRVLDGLSISHRL
jgi:hypothetical protein